MSTAVIEFQRPQVVRARTAPRSVPGLDTQRDAPPHRPDGPVRLTRRGRLVLLVAWVALVFGILTMVDDPAVSTSDTHHPTNATLVVEPGQTLWDVARLVAPSEDPRVVVSDIVDLNALADAGSVRAGQPLYLPQY